MTSEKNKKPGSDTTLPVRYVRDRLRETEKVIKTLKSDLSYFRTQNDEMAKERNDLLKMLSQKETLNEMQSHLEGDFMLVKDERDRLDDELYQLKQENKALKDRCSRLEAILAEEQDKHAETLEVVVCLEGQIEQLESMVEMLLEHKRFMIQENPDPEK